MYMDDHEDPVWEEQHSRKPAGFFEFLKALTLSFGFMVICTLLTIGAFIVVNSLLGPGHTGIAFCGAIALAATLVILGTYWQYRRQRRGSGEVSRESWNTASNKIPKKKIAKIPDGDAPTEKEAKKIRDRLRKLFGKDFKE